MPSSAAVAFEESVRRMTPVAAPEDQRESVAALMQLLKHVTSDLPEEAAYKLVSPTGEVIELPQSVFLLLERIIELLARGDAITVVPIAKELTTQQAASILNSAVTAYANCGSASVMLAGHTDRAGSTAYNVGLAERRNASVNSYLTGRGVPGTRITTEAFGESQPRVPTADGVREAQNRRVEVTYGPGSGM